MKRFSSLLFLLLLLPTNLFAAEISPAELLRRITSEVKPTNFTYRSVSSDAHTSETITVTGAREGKGPVKAWERVTIDWKGDGNWYALEIELRAKNGNAYARLKDVRGSLDSFVASLVPHRGKWYNIGSLNNERIREWFLPNIATLSSVLPFIDSTHERFKTGHSYAMTGKLGEGNRIATAVNAVTPFTLRRMFPHQVDVHAKVDTTLEGEFRYARLWLSSSFDGVMHTVDVTAQRQFSSVYTEMPKAIAPLSSDNALVDFLFGTSDISDVSSALNFSPTVSTVTGPDLVLPNHDSSGEMTLPSLEDPVAKRLTQRQGDRALVNIVNADTTNVKMTMRIIHPSLTDDVITGVRPNFGSERGMLFVYPRALMPSFSMRGSVVPLDVAFFDAAGNFISSAHMERCYGDSCPTLSPLTPALYVLVVQDGALAKQHISALSRLTFDQYSLHEVETYTSRSLIDRAAARRRSFLNVAVQPRNTREADLKGFEPIVTLAKSLASRIRSADVRAAIASGDLLGSPAKALYSILKEAELKHADISYASIVVPRSTNDQFALLLDTYSYASLELLDVNHNGRVDPEEAPAKVGALFVYPLFTDALSGPVVDTSIGGSVSVYVPIVDEQGVAIAVLALRQDSTGR